jgi:hypothetical protein
MNMDRLRQRNTKKMQRERIIKKQINPFYRPMIPKFLDLYKSALLTTTTKCALPRSSPWFSYPKVPRKIFGGHRVQLNYSFELRGLGCSLVHTRFYDGVAKYYSEGDAAGGRAFLMSLMDRYMGKKESKEYAIRRIQKQWRRYLVLKRLL